MKGSILLIGTLNRLQYDDICRAPAITFVIHNGVIYYITPFGTHVAVIKCTCLN